MIDWICENLGLAYVQEEGAGLALNRVAREALGDAHPEGLAEALMALGAQAPRVELEDAAQRARAGQRVVVPLSDDQRVLFAPTASGRACATLAPSQLASLAHRASATDLAAGVSHELANALGAIAGWARLAREGTRVEEALELIEKSADSAWSAARRVLGDVSKRDWSRGDAVNFSALVEEAARLLQPKALPHRVRIESNIEPGLAVSGQRGDLWSVVWNLSINGVEAMQDSGGRLQMKLHGTDDTVRLDVRDDGPGMTEEVRGRVFDQYYTTKRAGTGLGLAMVRKAVEAMGGTLSVESRPGEGSHFTVSLPRARGQAESLAKERHCSGVFSSEGLKARVLLVDDDTSLREMTATALEMRGATIHAVSTAAQALDARGPFDLAIVDLRLPDMVGTALLAQLRQRRIAQRALMITGMDLPAELSPEMRPDRVLRKPFDLRDLFEHCAEALNRAPAGRPRTETGG